MTICNMSIEGGARCGYINPDDTTFNYIRGRKYAPTENQWEKAISFWKSVASDTDCEYSDTVTLDGSTIEPMVTWGIGLDQSCNISETIPKDFRDTKMTRSDFEDACSYMDLTPGTKLDGVSIDVAFIGSCTNGRYSDFVEVAELLKNNPSLKVAKGIRALIVPGSHVVRSKLIAEGIADIFKNAGFDFREPGCSMCLAMNADKLRGNERCATSSNRNYKGRQGSPTGKTHVMSPAMVAATAIAGYITDARKVFS
jgi:3-isopropylmalate/(R)-2-methylmalate dehydratase large subunit